MAWTSTTGVDDARRQLPAWFSARMIGERGAFGLLLATGDVMRITSIMAVHHADAGAMLMDVLLDGAGPPQGVDHAWEVKHFLGAPVPGASMATVNMAHVVAVVEFVAAEIVEPAIHLISPANAEEELSGLAELPDIIARAGQ